MTGQAMTAAARSTSAAAADHAGSLVG
jgi:hypothetical protein